MRFAVQQGRGVLPVMHHYVDGVRNLPVAVEYRGFMEGVSVGQIVPQHVTEGSFDAYMWQALETKARFIGQVITGDNAARRAEDIGGQELSYAEVKAIASGNPPVLTLAEADAELQRLTLLKKNLLDEQFVARRSVRDLPGMIAGLSERLSKLSADEATAKTHAGDPITISGRTYPREDISETLGGKLDGLPKNVRETTRVPLGNYRGLRFGIVLQSQFPPDVFLEGGTTRQTMLSKEHQGPRAVLSALERLAGGYGSDCDRVSQDLAIAEAQLRDYQARLGKPFTHDGYEDTNDIQSASLFATALASSLSSVTTRMSDIYFPRRDNYLIDAAQEENKSRTTCRMACRVLAIRSAIEFSVSCRYHASASCRKAYSVSVRAPPQPHRAHKSCHPIPPAPAGRCAALLPPSKEPPLQS